MEINGVIEEVLKQDQDTGLLFFSGYYISNGEITTGNFLGHSRTLNVGDCFVAKGEWKDYMAGNGKKNSSFVIKNKGLRSSFPEDMNTLKLFLGCIFHATTQKYGVSWDSISKFVQKYNKKTLQYLLENANAVSELTNNEAHVKSLKEIWAYRSTGPILDQELLAAGIKPEDIAFMMTELTAKEFRYWSDVNLYSLVEIGVPFPILDKYAKYKGFLINNPKRLEAATEMIFKEMNKTSSTVFSVHDFMDAILKVLNMHENKEINEQIFQSISRGGIHHIKSIGSDIKVICNDVINKQEQYIAEELIRRMHLPTRSINSISNSVKDVLSKPAFKRFDSIQRLAVGMAGMEKFSIVTGGPGTGKSTVTEAIADLCELLGDHLYLVSPTGKAAKRLSETTKRKTSTMHHMLEATGNPDCPFRVNESNKLKNKAVVIIDETSIMDIDLMYGLLKALPDDGRIVFIGDKNQLPSVGPGAILADLLSSYAFNEQGVRIAILPSVELQKVYRQAKDSGIANGARDIKNGIVPPLPLKEDKGVQFVPSNASNVCKNVQNIFKEHLARGLKKEDIIIACPTRKGPGGTWELNATMSRMLNPDGAKIDGLKLNLADDRSMPLPRVGDRVMLTENDAKRGVMNGDVGYITGQRKIKGQNHIIVTYDSVDENNKQIVIEYPVRDWRQLILAYASTIHKLQGSQGKTVIMSIMAEQRNLYRNLIYTGWTRAEKNLVIVGDEKAITKAVKTVKDHERKTMLRIFLEGMSPKKLFGRSNVINWKKEAKARCKAMGIPFDDAPQKTWLENLTQKFSRTSTPNKKDGLSSLAIANSNKSAVIQQMPKKLNISGFTMEKSDSKVDKKENVQVIKKEEKVLSEKKPLKLSVMKLNLPSKAQNNDNLKREDTSSQNTSKQEPVKTQVSGTSPRVINFKKFTIKTPGM